MGNETFGKMEMDNMDEVILMEYKHFYVLLARFIPPGTLSENKGFQNFLLNSGDLIYEYSDFMVITLPDPRVLYYQSNDYFEIQKGVTGYAN